MYSVAQSSSVAGTDSIDAGSAARIRSSACSVTPAARRAAATAGSTVELECTRRVSTVLQTLGRWVLAFRRISTAMSSLAEASRKMWTLPSPVSMTGTAAFVTTDWIRSRPPRGIRTSTRPRARIRALAPSRPYWSTVWTASAGRPTDSRASRRMVTRAALVAAAADAAAQDHGVAALEGQPGDVDGDVGAGLVDGGHHAHGHVDLAQPQPVGQGLAAHHVADRIGQGGEVFQGGGEGLRSGCRSA